MLTRRACLPGRPTARSGPVRYQSPAACVGLSHELAVWDRVRRLTQLVTVAVLWGVNAIFRFPFVLPKQKQN